MVRDRAVGRRPSKAVKGIQHIRVPPKLRKQDRDTVRRKKCHHHLKLIHKALKKARQFEVGKLKRRLKAAPAADRAKLETQLVALGKVDLDTAAQQAAAACGVAERSSNATTDAVPAGAAPPTEGLQPALRVLSARLLAAKCVREEVEAAQQSLAALDAAAAAQERRQQQIAQRQAERAQRKQDAAAAPSANGGHSGEQAAQQPSDDEDWASMLGSNSESDDEAVQARKRQLLLGNPEQEAGTDGGAAQQRQQAGSVGGSKQPKPQKQLPKKPKNRLGQRARRKMAEQAFGDGARHMVPSSGPGRPAITAAAAPDALGRAAARPQGPAAPPRRAAAAARAADAAPAAAAGAELHPSWAAKSAAKAQLAAKPAGRKVVFSDDGDAVPAAEPAANGTRQQHAPGGTLRKRAGTGEPTEAAARAVDMRAPQAAPQAPSRVPGVPRHRDQRRASAASGAPSSGGKRPAAKLHPSWEAKAKLRKQMESLPAPAGTKVVFEDSE